MKYQVAYGIGMHFSEALDDLEEDVKKLCEKGFKPQGGISITVDPDGACIAAQAMIKKR